MISPIFTTIVLTFGFIWIYMKLSTKNVGKEDEKFIEREVRANKVRKQPLDSLVYLTIPLEDIPHSGNYPSERIAELTQTLEELSHETIVNLTGISNTDLKLTYGAPNLPILSEYDLNFTKTCTTLYDLGVEYDTLGLKDEAIKVLNVAITLGTDISKNYTHLAGLYAERGDYAQIQRLITAADDIRSITKQSTVSKLLDILDAGTSYVSPKGVESSATNDALDSILPKDILDILETVPYKSDDQTK